MSEPDLQAQAVEVELHRRGLRDLLERAAAGRIKRPHEIDRLRERLEVSAAASATMARLAAGSKA